MLNQVLPEKGKLLISEPFMDDPNFKRSVVLLTDYSDEGAVGYVLNQTSDFLLKDLVEECWDAQMQVYLGGPVAADTLHFIHKSPDKIPDGEDLGNGLFWGGNFESLKAQILNYNIKNDEIRFFIGYSGWSKNQLEEELINNSWIVSEKLYPEMIFDDSGVDLWKESIMNLGVKYAHIANFPEDPMMN